MGMALEAGDLVDQKYRIVRFIGRGAWASVYEGVNARIGRRVAIKVLSDEAIQKPGIVERFEREAQAATRIDSVHVVHVFDLGVLPDGRPYIVMELLEGSNLGQTLNDRGNMSEGRAVFYTVQALRGLGEAHSAGVMHRDIKPDNMVLVKTKHGDEVLKIVDFGISKLQSGLQAANNMTQTNTVLGSPVYMSPEQCRGTKHMDHRSDLYSLGVVLFELLTGQVPHKGDTFNELMFKIALEDTPSAQTVRPDLDPDLCAIISKALRREPGDRFQTAAEFEQALLDWANSHGIDTSTWFERRSRLHITGETDGRPSSSRRAAPPVSVELGDTGPRGATSDPKLSASNDKATVAEPHASAITNPGIGSKTTGGTTTDTLASSARKRGWLVGVVAGMGVLLFAGIFLILRSTGASGRTTVGASGSAPDPTATAPATATQVTPNPSATQATTTTGGATSATEPSGGLHPIPDAPPPVESAAQRPLPNGWVPPHRPGPGPTPPARPSAVGTSTVATATPPQPPPPQPNPSGNSMVDGRRIRTDL